MSTYEWLEQQNAKLSAALHAWVAVDEESSDKHPCPDLALRATLRCKARELTIIASPQNGRHSIFRRRTYRKIQGH